MCVIAIHTHVCILILLMLCFGVVLSVCVCLCLSVICVCACVCVMTCLCLCVHVVILYVTFLFWQAPSELLMQVVKDLDKQAKNKYAAKKLNFSCISMACDVPLYRAMLVETRILVYATNIKTKFYGHWCHRVLNLPTLQKGESYQTHNPIHDTVCVCVCVRVCVSDILCVVSTYLCVHIS